MANGFPFFDQHRQQSEKIGNLDYLKRRVEQMASEYESLDPEWKPVYLQGLDRQDFLAIIKHFQTKGKQ